MRRHYLVILGLVICVSPVAAQERDLIARVKSTGEVVILDKDLGIKGKLFSNRGTCVSPDYWSMDGKTVFSCGAGFGFKVQGAPIDFSKTGDTVLMFDPNTKPGPGTDDPGPSKAPEDDNDG